MWQYKRTTKKEMHTDFIKVWKQIGTVLISCIISHQFEYLNVFLFVFNCWLINE